MSETRFAVTVEPGQLHFNAAHFITFNDTCENLHGHNFHARVEAVGANNPDGYVLDFVELTKLAEGICQFLNDKVLLPGRSEVVNLERDGDVVHVASYGRRFVLPADNCAVLPVSNTTAELLAWYIGDRLLAEMRKDGGLDNVEYLQVAVEEADRQWGICRREVRNVR